MNADGSIPIISDIPGLLGNLLSGNDPHYIVYGFIIIVFIICIYIYFKYRVKPDTENNEINPNQQFSV